MLRSFVLLLVATSFGWAAEPKELAIPPEKVAEAKALIAKLDDDDMGVRDMASAGLEKLGRFALPALLEAEKGKPSNEVRNRLEKLVPLARKADFDVRYPLFLNDTEGKREHDLLGWNDLKAAAGDTKESRLLMTDILNEERLREMLLSAVATGKVDQDVFAGRWDEKSKAWGASGRGFRPAKDEPMTFLCAGWLQDLVCPRDYSPTGGTIRSAVMTKYLTVADDGKKSVLGNGRYGSAFTKLAKRWIDTRTGPHGFSDAEHLCRDLKLEEEERVKVIYRAVDWAVDHGVGRSEIMMLGLTEDRRHVSALKRFFDTSAVAMPASAQGDYEDIQVRDVALAVCALLTDQNPADYGFAVRRPNAVGKGRYDATNYFFKSDDKQTADDKRTAAFKKWAEWEKANPDKLKAKPAEKKDK